MLDENYNNLADAVISVGGINHDVTSGKWPLLRGIKGKFHFLIFFSMIRWPVCKPGRQAGMSKTWSGGLEEGSLVEMGALN